MSDRIRLTRGCFSVLASAGPRAAVLAVAALAATAASAHAARPIGQLGKLQRTPAITLAEDVAQGGCPAVAAHYSRGAGENEEYASVDWPNRSKYYGGVGEEMSVLANYLAEQVYPPVGGKPQLKTVANIAPPADDPFNESYFPASLEISTAAVRETIRSIKTGATAFLDDINAIRTACPDTRLVFVGYSQGAAVIRAALAATPERPVNGRWLKNPPAAGRSIAMVFGDAHWNTNPEYRTGTRYVGDTYLPTGVGNAGEQGLASVLWHTLGSTLFGPADRPYAYPYATPDRYDLVSFCHGRDPSCQFARQTGQAIGLYGHLDYDVREPFAAAGLVAQQFAPGGVKASIAVPTVKIPEGQACLTPRGASKTLQALADGSPAGTSTRVSASWQVSGAFFNGRPAAGSSISAVVSPGGPQTLGVRLSGSLLSNDVLQITSPSAISPTGSASLYETRICPLL